MTEKKKILEVLGGDKADLLLMEKVRRALQANERVKYLLSLLQLAMNQARVQAPDPDDLSVERLRSGIEEAGLDRVISSAAITPAGDLQIPEADRIILLALDETARMCAPLQIARSPVAKSLGQRLRSIREECQPLVDGKIPEGAAAARPGATGDGVRSTLPVEFIPRLTSADRSGGDSLHLVVMDAHKALNGLIADVGSRREKVGGAEALGLNPQDRKLLDVFMTGVNRTAPLKGSHPGLGATAMRVGSKLVIQNDLGETDAHVVLVEVEKGKLEITYTDVHSRRVDFFMTILGDLGIRWKKTESKTSKELVESAFFLLRGTLQVSDITRLEVPLQTIGESLVFLIDWNKARKRMRTFLRGSDVLKVLQWSSAERIGHMAFLSYGEEELIYETLEALPRGRVRLGEPLSSILGRKGSVEFMKDVLRLCRESYDRKEPRILLVDRLRCQLLARVQRRGGSAEEMALELASLSVETSLVFRDALRTMTRISPGLISRSHQRIIRWEERADDRLNRIRKLNLREPQPLLPVAEKIDDAMDALEDGCDLARAISGRFDAKALPAELVGMLEESAELALCSAQLFLRTVYQYRELVQGGIGEKLFNTIYRLKQAESRGDQIKRAFRWKFLEAPGDLKMLGALRELQELIEEAINSWCRGAFLIHDLAYTAMESRHG